MLVLAEAIILIVGRFDLSLESIVGVAPMFGAWLVLDAVAERGSGLMLNPYLCGDPRLFAVGFAIGALQRLPDRPPRAERLHHDARDADPAPRRHRSASPTDGPSTTCRSPCSISATPTGSAFRPRSGCRRGSISSAASILAYHRFGRALYAIGGNAEAARAAGIPVDRYAVDVFVIAGGLAGLGRGPDAHRPDGVGHVGPGPEHDLHRLRGRRDRADQPQRRQGHRLSARSAA